MDGFIFYISKNQNVVHAFLQSNTTENLKFNPKKSKDTPAETKALGAAE